MAQRISFVFFSCLLSMIVNVSGLRAQELTVANDTNASTFFIVTRPDLRRCAYPMCGGYFVKRVNQDKTLCADGVTREECHVVDFDFEASGLDADTAQKFVDTLLGQGFGLVRGKLGLRNVGANVPADTLAVTEAWAGQAQSSPNGVFFRFSDTGLRCFTSPCPIYLGERLNTPVQLTFSSVDLVASGADEEAIDQGYTELSETAILAAGVTTPISGPAGRGYDFTASEFYLRVKPAE